MRRTIRRRRILRSLSHSGRERGVLLPRPLHKTFENCHSLFPFSLHLHCISLDKYMLPPICRGNSVRTLAACRRGGGGGIPEVAHPPAACVQANRRTSENEGGILCELFTKCEFSDAYGRPSWERGGPAQDEGEGKGTLLSREGEGSLRPLQIASQVWAIRMESTLCLLGTKRESKKYLPDRMSLGRPRRGLMSTHCMQ